MLCSAFTFRSPSFSRLLSLTPRLSPSPSLHLSSPPLLSSLRCITPSFPSLSRCLCRLLISLWRDTYLWRGIHLCCSLGIYIPACLLLTSLSLSLPLPQCHLTLFGKTSTSIFLSVTDSSSVFIAVPSLTLLLYINYRSAKSASALRRTTYLSLLPLQTSLFWGPLPISWWRKGCSLFSLGCIVICLYPADQHNSQMFGHL